MLSQLLIGIFTLIASVGHCTISPLVDSYLYARYLATPKVDSSGAFEGKDAIAATRAGLNQEEYAIGCMGTDFKRRLMLFSQWAEREKGISVGITSGYRDDYRQAMTRGRNRNQPGHSFHGGSLVGGCHHGKAADLVAIAPTREESTKLNPDLWSLIDREGKRFGIGRPYGDRDAPHVAPLESREFAVAKARIREHMLAARRKKAAHRRALARHHHKMHVATANRSPA